MLDLNNKEDRLIFKQACILDKYLERQVKKKGFCHYEKCHRGAETKGLCNKHYYHHRKLEKEGKEGLVKDKDLEKYDDYIYRKEIVELIIRTKEGAYSKLNIYTKKGFTLIEEKEVENGYYMKLEVERKH